MLSKQQHLIKSMPSICTKRKHILICASIRNWVTYVTWQKHFQFTIDRYVPVNTWFIRTCVIDGYVAMSYQLIGCTKKYAEHSSAMLPYFVTVRILHE